MRKLITGLTLAGTLFGLHGYIFSTAIQTGAVGVQAPAPIAQSSATKLKKATKKKTATNPPTTKPPNKTGAPQAQQPPAETDQITLGKGNGDQLECCLNQNKDKCRVFVVNGASQVRDGTLISLAGGVAVVSFKAPSDFRPVTIIVQVPGTKDKPSNIVPVADTKDKPSSTIVLPVQNTPDIPEFQRFQIIAEGDFREAEKNEKESKKACTAYLSNGDNGTVDAAEVSFVSAGTALVKYDASGNFVPQKINLQCTTGTFVVPFKIFNGLSHEVTSFFSKDINKDFCGGKCNTVDAANFTIAPLPDDPNVEAKLIRVATGQVFVELTAPPDYAPQYLQITLTKTNKSVMAMP